MKVLLTDKPFTTFECFFFLSPAGALHIFYHREALFTTLSKDGVYRADTADIIETMQIPASQSVQYILTLNMNRRADSHTSISLKHLIWQKISQRVWLYCSSKATLRKITVFVALYLKEREMCGIVSHYSLSGFHKTTANSCACECFLYCLMESSQVNRLTTLVRNIYIWIFTSLSSRSQKQHHSPSVSVCLRPRLISDIRLWEFECFNRISVKLFTMEWQAIGYLHWHETAPNER